MQPSLVACFLTLLASSAALSEPLLQPVKKKKVEIVFAIDTTGSMGGLIEGAKRKIWSIAKEVQRAQQKPELHIGLVAFRDQQDAYVTQTTPLTTDLDAIYEKLMALQADGGGDTPEDVNAALHAAVSSMKWSEDKDTLKMIFLVGDAPPHMDYAQQVTWQKSAQAATRKNIFINTVQCGADPQTTTAWRAIAHAAEGRYAAIPQDGGVVAVATPFDDHLKKLAKDLDGTYLEYGSEAFRGDKRAVRERAGALASTAAPASVAADRASAKAAAAPKASEDIIDLAKAIGGAGRALASVKDEALPTVLQGKSKLAQQQVIEELSKKRDALNKEIASVSKQRDAHVAAAHSGAPADAFDSEVVSALHEQAATTGLTY